MISSSPLGYILRIKKLFDATSHVKINITYNKTINHKKESKTPYINLTEVQIYKN